MKKIYNFLKFLFISVIVFIVLGYVGNFLFSRIWHFYIFNEKSYARFINSWNQGNTINIFLVLSLILMPVLWIYFSFKLYKFGLLKFIFYPLIKLYKYLSKPKDIPEVHVCIKNLGGKEKNIDEIIGNKMKEKGMNKGKGSMSDGIRKQISTKIKENSEE